MSMYSSALWACVMEPRPRTDGRTRDPEEPARFRAEADTAAFTLTRQRKGQRLCLAVGLRRERRYRGVVLQCLDGALR